MGSPPRVRGKVLWSAARNCHGGITPACAGKRSVPIHRTRRLWDHPRVCGEKYVHPTIDDARKGSPPRVRGKDIDPVKAVSGSRITPACAGKRNKLVFGDTATRDHPRVCGEKGNAFSDLVFDEGSPPRVRGKVPWVSVSDVPVGITPACAGKRYNNLENVRPRRDHPRVCGEKTKKIP